MPKWIDPRDLVPQGPAETVVDLGDTVILGLHVLAADASSLGLLAVKCEKRVRGGYIPTSVADTLAIDTTQTLQSNPRRAWVRRFQGDTPS